MSTATFTITIASSPSTSVMVTPVTGLVAPVAAGTLLATLSVQPVGWSGGVSLSGPNAAQMQVGGASPNYTILAATQLVVGSYTATVTVSP